MNKKGVLFMLGFMMFLLIFIVTIVMLQPIKESVGLARNSANLDCDNTSLSTGEKMSCILVDWQLPLFAGTAFAAALGWIGIKQYRSNGEG